MCGIAGTLGDFDLETLEMMSGVLKHRGPDDSGVFWDPRDRIGLAHQRLSIIDLSPSGHQPMWDCTDRAVVVFNGEIYNHLELRDTLSKEGYRFKSRADTEVFLASYLRHGIGCFSQFNGIFAVALWDTQLKQLVLARDSFGVKPLYLAKTSQGLLFASEIKALLRARELDRSLDPMAISQYVSLLYAPGSGTILRAVRKVAPGHAIVTSTDGTQRSIEFRGIPYGRPDRTMSLSDAIRGVQNGVATAVRRQMIADVPVGAFLSGGLDSSAVVAFASAPAAPKKLTCFTIGVAPGEIHREGWPDDLPYAQLAANHLGVELHTIQVGSEMASQLEQMVYLLDEPLADPAALNVLSISQLARKHGIKVLLSGAGGDDLFTGYRRHYALQLENYWRWLPRGFRKVLRKLSSRVSSRSPIGRRIAKAFRYADAEVDARIAGYFRWLEPSILARLYGPALRDGIGDSDPADVFLQTLAALPANVDSLSRMLYLDQKFFLTDHNLNYTDKMSMAAGIEVRVPLLDLDLVEFAAKLPLEFKQVGSSGKWIFKKAMEPYLPREIIYRRKTGFGVPLRAWLHRDLARTLGELLDESSLRRRGLFEPKAVTKLVALDRAGKIDATYPIFALLCIELWLRTFVDRR